MKAPSEKHLEDWIVDYPEYVGYSVDDIDPDDWWDGFLPLINRVLTRQTKLPSGISDLIVLATGIQDISIAVVEIKRNAINADTLAQTLRYMRDIREIFYWARCDFGFHDNYYPDIGVWGSCHGLTPEVTGVMIGHSLSDRNIAIAGEACGIVSVLYDYDPTSNMYKFDITGDDERIPATQRLNVYKEFTFGSIGIGMREVMEHRLLDYQRQKNRG